LLRANQGEISFTNEQFLALIEINKQQALQIEILTQQLAQLKKMVFGSKHERTELLNLGQ
jgi:hypothetical protein